MAGEYGVIRNTHLELAQIEKIREVIELKEKNKENIITHESKFKGLSNTLIKLDDNDIYAVKTNVTKEFDGRDGCTYRVFKSDKALDTMNMELPYIDLAIDIDPEINKITSFGYNLNHPHGVIHYITPLLNMTTRAKLILPLFKCIN